MTRLTDKQREMLLGHRKTDAAPVTLGEMWEVNGHAWRVAKIVSRNRIVLKCEGKIARKKSAAPWYVRLWRCLTRRNG